MKHMVDKLVPEPFRCEDCKHYIEFAKCKAFDIIPIEYAGIGENHTKVLKGQKGKYVFETDKERNYMRVYGVEE